MDDNENCYIIFKNKSDNPNFFESEFLEIFLLIPLKDYEATKTLVIFLTNIDFLNDKSKFEWSLSEILNFEFKNLIFPNSITIPYFTAQKLKEERLMILANLKEFIVNFNSFELDSIISQIPNIRNLSISRSNTKNENELRKIISGQSGELNNNCLKFKQNGSVKALNINDQNGYLTNNINSSIISPPAYYKNVHINSSDEIINNYNNNNLNNHYANNLDYKSKHGIDSIEKIKNHPENYNNKCNHKSSTENKVIGNASNKNNSLNLSFDSNNRILSNKNLYTAPNIDSNFEPYESYYDARSEVSVAPSENMLISYKGEIRYSQIINQSNQNSNKMLNNNQSINVNQRNLSFHINNNQNIQNFPNNQMNYNNFISQINPKSIITNGKPVLLGERLQNYYKNPEGGVECRNHEELHTQDGIILELMKRAGKQLLEGKNIVGVSLPVKIFEPRSTLIRLTDLWGTAYEYFNKAAESINPIERIKMIIIMAMSGIHMNAKQTKPFNPILGETYEVFLL